MERKSSSNKTTDARRQPILTEKGWRRLFDTLLFALAWLWAAWWMGDAYRMAYEYSFFAPDSTLMHFLWQKPFGSLWILGRMLLTLYRWPLVGGFATAALLAAASWLTGYCLRLRPRWRSLQWLPAVAWMSWVAWQGLNLYYLAEPGRTLGALLLGVGVLAIDAFIIWTFKSRRHHTAAATTPQESSSSPNSSFFILHFSLLILSLAPIAITSLRHPYLRPLTRMQVQMLAEDWEGMAATAKSDASLSYRPLAAYYAIALVHTGHIADELFDVRLDYDSLYIVGRSGTPDIGTSYYIVDGNYTAGLFRAAEHKAMEQLTMDGPSLYTLKHLTRLALLDHNWALARKYLDIIGRSPFEGAFIRRYSAMLGSAERVAADPEFALLRQTEPLHDSFESYYQAPTFLGYNAVLYEGRTQTALIHSLMTNLYSKRMPAFLERCEPLVGSMPPKTIAEGLVTQATKNPAIMQAFPQLQMTLQMYMTFVRNNAAAMKDRPAHARELFESNRGYYPYYYFFGNLKATRKRDNSEGGSSSAGVN